MADWARTERLPAEIRMADGTCFRGEVHLQPMVGQHQGPETPLEMLNRGDAYFPLTPESGGIAFMAKAQVAVVTCPPGVAQSEAEQMGVAKTIRLQVTLAGGDSLEGWSAVELPPTRSRALDYLNLPGAFFTLRSDRATWFLNSSHVRLVRPLD